MLTLTNLRKHFGPASRRVVAVDGVSLTVRKGEVFGLLGPNGAGKSTTIGMATGLISPDEGTVNIEGAGAPTTSTARLHLGVAPQELALYEQLTGEENLRFFGKLYELSGDALSKRVDTVLELVGLSPRRQDRVVTYSGGMKRRLNLAVALIHDPPLLLLDEPTAGVDPHSRNNLIDVVRKLASEGRTIIYTTHYMEEASKLCDRIAIMDKGKVLAQGTLSELTAAHGGHTVVTVSHGDSQERIETADPLKEIARVMAAGTATNVRIDAPDLESVFLALTGRSMRD
ncbi:putative ABC transporter ATP-binding protein YfiL [Phycisphaerae bacterium]|jgi:ABC-2 type transport system ATP-binding protein|nr:putative ABC transporter ATP-binding protein YfiL [Phycisphaerae bacterium]